MKNILLPLFGILCFNLLNAQVPNDDCFTATDLGTLSLNESEVCWDGTNYFSIVAMGNTNGATPSSPFYSMNNCYGYATSTTTLADDIWFKFKTPSNAIVLRVPTTDTIHINLYHGTNCTSLQPLGCWTHDMTQWQHEFYSNNDTSIWNYIQLSGVAPGNSLLYGICMRMWTIPVSYFGTIQINNNTSVSAISPLDKVFISPNPGEGTFIIDVSSSDSETLLEIFDVKGNIIYKRNLPVSNGPHEISLPPYITNGIYNCVITSDSVKVCKKLVLIRN